MKHIGVDLQVTNEKDHEMIELWDDLKLVHVQKNTGEPMNNTYL
jgi:hypothetical protein